MTPKGKYIWQYFLNKDAIPSERILKLNEESKIKFLDRVESGTYKYKRYWNDTTDTDGKFIEGNGRGQPILNVWEDIFRLTSKKEGEGYPTQKPEKLLERIILASSNKDMIVLDPFMGGGTTIKVAKDNNRKFIGIDVSLIACNHTSKKIGYPENKIEGRPQTLDDLNKMTPWEFQQWSCDKMQARNKKPRGGADQGVDGIIHLDSRSLFDEDKAIKSKYNGCPIQVKQSESIGENPVKQLFATMYDEKKKYGFIIAYSFTKTAYEKVAKYKNEDSVIIKLITAEELCKIDKYNYEE